MKPVKSKNFKEPIVLTKILDNKSLLVVDAKTSIRYLDKNSLKLLGGFKANITHIRYKNSVVAFSSDGNYFATLSSDCRESRLYNAKEKKLIATVDKHHGEAACVGIDTKAKYMFSCGDDGKTYAIDVTTGKLSFTLPVHVDTVNDIAFSSNGNWVATASYDKKISLFHLSMMTPKEKLKSHVAPVMKLHFIDQNRLISIDKNSKAIIWDVYTGKVLARLNGIHDDVTHITTAEDHKFIFLGSALGYVMLYDAQTYELLSKKYIKVDSSITSLIYDEEEKNLILGTQNGDLEFYYLYDGETHLKALLQEKKYNEIQSHVDANPILANTQIYDLVSNLWENTLKKAKQCLQKGDKKMAISLLSHFKSIPSKNRIIQQVIAEYAEYDKFVDVAKQGKLALAYGLAAKHPLYKETPIYRSLEKRWKQAFELALKYSLDPKGVDTAREILAPYRGISDKTKMIQDLFNQSEVYKRFKVAIGQKDFKIAFELVKLHEFLKDFPEYSTIMDYGDNLYVQSQKLINSGDTHAATKMLRVLVEFPDFAPEAKELVGDIERKQKFFKAIKDDDLITAYNMLESSEGLHETDDGKRLQEQWNDDVAIASACATLGDTDGITNALESYLTISSKYPSIGAIYGLSYLTQLEQALDENMTHESIEEGIKNYVLNFGIEDQILNFYEVFMKKYPHSKLNLDLLTKGDITMWRPSMVVSSILD